jgi:hypothetical protein
MRSRGLRLTFGACSCIAIAAAAVFLYLSEQRLSMDRAAVQPFDARARDAAAHFADLKTAQLAYVAVGQGTGIWLPKADAIKASLFAELASLRQAAGAAASALALDDAAAALEEFGRVDKRVRDYLSNGAQVMASDVVFAEGIDVTTRGASAVERARLEARRDLDDLDAWRRRQEALALVGAAALTILVVALLIRLPAAGETREAPAVTSLSLRDAPAETPPAVEARPQPVKLSAGPTLGMAAQLCTDLGRMGDPSDVNGVLGQTADVLNASGLVVWIRSASGAELIPAFAYGYSDDMVARLPKIPRSADNAAAAAYRTGSLQIVLSRPGTSKGAVAAPLLSIDGCAGVLSAEIRDGGETSDVVQALVRILAAQLSGLLVPDSVTPAADAPRAASGAAL